MKYKVFAQISLGEVTLFCQCLHNFHLMESIDQPLMATNSKFCHFY